MFSERAMGRERFRRGGLEPDHEFNAETRVDDERLGRVVLIEGLPGEGRRRKGDTIVVAWMVLFIFVLEELHLKREIIGGEEKCDEARKSRRKEGNMEKNPGHRTV